MTLGPAGLAGPQVAARYFLDALAAFVCAWPTEFLTLARDPERMGVLCRALREAIPGLAQDRITREAGCASG